jgi:hypothetical protein
MPIPRDGRWTTRVRDLLTDQGNPLYPDEWTDRRVVRDDGSLLVRLWGEATQEQAIEILRENTVDLVVTPFGDESIIVRPRTDADDYRVDFTTPGFVRPGA